MRTIHRWQFLDGSGDEQRQWYGVRFLVGCGKASVFCVLWSYSNWNIARLITKNVDILTTILSIPCMHDRPPVVACISDCTILFMKRIYHIPFCMLLDVGFQRAECPMVILGTCGKAAYPGSSIQTHEDTGCLSIVSMIMHCKMMFTAALVQSQIFNYIAAFSLPVNSVSGWATLYELLS